jgi:hypothetical protein
LTSKRDMRLITLLVTAILWSNQTFAQQPQPSAPAENPSSAQDGTTTTGTTTTTGATGTQDEGPKTLTVPVSLDKIREALAQPPPSEPLIGLNEPPTFRLEIQERQRFEALMEKIKFDKGGPIVAGGRDAYDQQQRLFPRIDNPRLQPYGAFSTGEIMTLSVEALVEKYVAQKVAHVFGDVLRVQAEREAREEVARALAGFWASQPAVPPKE